MKLLCKKLEVAKRERDEREAAALLRKQVRESVKKGGYVPRHADSKRCSTTSVIDVRERPSWYKSPTKLEKRFWDDGKQGGNVERPYTSVTVDIPKDGPIDSYDLISPELDQDENGRVLLSRGSSPCEGDYFSQQRNKNRIKRSSFAILKDFGTSNRDETRRNANTSNVRPGDTAKRRSQTLPLLVKSKFFRSKQDMNAASENAQKRSKTGTDELESPGLLNEYTISFDTCRVKEEVCRRDDYLERPRPQPMQRPSWARRDGMRSLLNLPLILKKDKKEQPAADVQEIHDEVLDNEEPAARRPHTRSQTVPDEMICRPVSNHTNKEEKIKKRRTVGDLLQTILLPKHSMSHHHEVAAI